MTHKILILFLSLSTFFQVAAVLANDDTYSLSVSGTKREYLLHMPSGAATKQSLPVVLLFHGGGGRASGMADMTGMNEVSDRYGFIAVYPEGLYRTWNAGICCGRAVKNHVDDVSFVSALIDDLRQHYAIDTKRVYATGMSNGSQFSYRLACELSDKIAAIAPVSGQSVMTTPCNPVRRVPILHIHGTADPCAPYEGGKQCGGCYGKILPGIGDTWPCDPVEQQIASTAQRNGCMQSTATSFSKGDVICEAFKGCPTNADVTLCKVKNAGHTWPGGQYPSFCQNRPNGFLCRKYKEAVGTASNDINASEFIWGFFSKHHL